MNDAPVTYNNDEQAAAAIEGLIDQELAKADAPADAPAAPPAKAQSQQEAPAEPQDAAPAEEAPQEDTVASVKRKVRIKGEKGEDIEEEHTVAELELGYMRQADYQRKTADTARQREQIETQSRQAADQARQQYLTQAQLAQKALLQVAAPEFAQQGVDLTNQMAVQAHLSKLAKDDPAEAVRMSNRLAEIYTAFNVIGKNMENETAKVRQARAQAFSKSAREAWDTLSGKVKGWNDETYNRLLKTGYEYGFKPEEIANPVGQDGKIPDGYIPATDPRFIELLHDADQYRQQKRQQPLIEKKVSEAPKVIKPGSTAKAENATRQQESMTKLRKSGKIDDAAAAIMAKFG
jgi:hypothetical protein